MFKRNVTVVIPIWKPNLDKFEKISFTQCCRVLKKRKISIITWRGLDLRKYISILEKEYVKYRIIFFKKKYFINVRGYNKLMLSLFFYIHFFRFKYILIYQLDCFVFYDELDMWIQKGYSYIGAPWLQGYGAAQYGSPVVGVGNGGLSLRRVKDHIRVLLSFKLIIYFIFNKIDINEDIFWCKVVVNKFSWFTVPNWKVASRFSIEVQPKYFINNNNNQIPFGCHAWWKYDIFFWKPYIEKFGYKIP